MIEFDQKWLLWSQNLPQGATNYKSAFEARICGARVFPQAAASGRSFQNFFIFYSTYPGPRYAEMTLSIPCLWNFRILLVVICFLCLCGVTITNYKNSLFMSIKDIMDLSHVLCCYYDLYRKYPRYTQLSPPHGPHSGRFLLYCIYQYKQRIERSCVQQKLAIINNIQIFCMIEQNKIFSVKSWNIK